MKLSNQARPDANMGNHAGMTSRLRCGGDRTRVGNAISLLSVRANYSLKTSPSIPRCLHLGGSERFFLTTTSQRSPVFSLTALLSIQPCQAELSVFPRLLVQTSMPSRHPSPSRPICSAPLPPLVVFFCESPSDLHSPLLSSPANPTAVMTLDTLMASLVQKCSSTSSRALTQPH